MAWADSRHLVAAAAVGMLVVAAVLVAMNLRTASEERRGGMLYSVGGWGEPATYRLSVTLSPNPTAKGVVLVAYEPHGDNMYNRLVDAGVVGQVLSSQRSVDNRGNPFWAVYLGDIESKTTVDFVARVQTRAVRATVDKPDVVVENWLVREVGQYIQPQDPLVADTAAALGGGQDGLLVAGAAHTWVYTNIPSTPMGGVQTPRQTLEAGQGSCLDKAYLMSSLLVARGVGASSVLVAVRGQALPLHALVRVYLPQGSLYDDPSLSAEFGALEQAEYIVIKEPVDSSPVALPNYSSRRLFDGAHVFWENGVLLTDWSLSVT